MLTIHVLNLHLDLEPVLGNLAREAGLTALYQSDTQISIDEKARGKSGDLVRQQLPGALLQVVEETNRVQVRSSEELPHGGVRPSIAQEYTSRHNA